MDSNGKFYLGKLFDPQAQNRTDKVLLYDPADLTTHAVVVGMTGSGKTGLCLDLLEEAALNGVPALMIDPKGDIANSLLHFPDLAPQDFLPWINPDQARRAGKTLEQAALETSSLYRQQLADWDIQPDRILALKNSATFTIYTPGSEAGIPVSILASLKAPTIPWQDNREVLREKISGTVTALLGLVGLQDIDPVRSREHILLSNIFEQAWSQGKDLDLGELILQTQAPPFAKLGVFDVNTFFPEKDRFSLAMLINNILAAPAFQSWIEGQPLDIPGFLYTEEGRPRHSVFYIAHLSDTERMFFVTLLFSAVETWMRSQAGTNSLRAILYFDEIFGYLPPTANPPSKEPMLRMLKQARAFGVGLLLVTQNPVDVDYKALSNAGTWFIGKLQTDQDKQRLLDGLQGAMSGDLDRGQYDRLISTLGKRVFLLHNVHALQPMLFETRWAMNYLAGPITRTQIPQLNNLWKPATDQTTTPSPASVTATPAPPAKAEPTQTTQTQEAVSLPVSSPAPALQEGVSQQGPIAMPAPAAPVESRQAGPVSGTTATRPAIPAGVKEYFLPNNLTFTQAFKAAGRAYPQEAFSQGFLYRPVLLSQAGVRFFSRKFNLDYEKRTTVLVPAPDRRGMVKWENFQSASVDPQAIEDAPAPQARYANLQDTFSDAKSLAALKKDFLDWAYRTSQVTVRANETLGLYAGPETSTADFHARCAEAARLASDEEIKKTSGGFDKKIEAVQLKLEREQRDLGEAQNETSQRKMEELGTDVENVLGFFGGRRSSRRVSTSLTKHRLTEQAKAKVEESQLTIQQLKSQLAELQKEKDQSLAEINQRWGEAVTQNREIAVPAMKKDVLLELFGVAWFPYYVVKSGEDVIELAGYSHE
jgi:hypothetical protein